MKIEIIKKLPASFLRIFLLLAILLWLPAIAYWIWSPGSWEPLPAYPDNAIWIGHGWIGDDAWFQRNRRNVENFRTEEKITELLTQLRENRVSIVFPHLCPAQYNGKIAPYDDTQIERFLDLAERFHVRVIPWVGGVWNESAQIGNEAWRRNFIASIAELLKKHPRLAGVQVNIEPLPDWNKDFLFLLEELRAAIPGKSLSVAAYPPPTKWQKSTLVHWSIGYYHRIAERCDLLTVMMYDTSIPLEKFYVRLMTEWTKKLDSAVFQSDCKLLLGVPAYEDADVGYHHPGVENLTSALRGISAASDRRRISGIAIYCEWEMNAPKWREWRKFIR